MLRTLEIWAGKRSTSAAFLSIHCLDARRGAERGRPLARVSTAARGFNAERMVRRQRDGKEGRVRSRALFDCDGPELIDAIPRHGGHRSPYTARTTALP